MGEIKSKVDELAKFIMRDKKLYGADKHECISAYLKELGHDVSPEIIKQTQTLDRAWRKALELNKDLDHRGSTKEAEDYVKSEMGYPVGGN